MLSQIKITFICADQRFICVNLRETKSFKLSKFKQIKRNHEKNIYSYFSLSTYRIGYQ
jgi:hypothetical protein